MRDRRSPRGPVGVRSLQVLSVPGQFCGRVATSIPDEPGKHPRDAKYPNVREETAFGGWATVPLDTFSDHVARAAAARELGRNEGFQAGNTEGEARGIEIGRDAGRAQGYSQGRADSVEEGKTMAVPNLIPA